MLKKLEWMAWKSETKSPMGIREDRDRLLHDMVILVDLVQRLGVVTDAFGWYVARVWIGGTVCVPATTLE